MTVFRSLQRAGARGPRLLTCAALALAIAVGVSAAPATAPANDQRMIANFIDTDISKVAEAVHMVTHKTFIIDPRVRAQVTIYSSTPMSPEAFYQAFVSILQVHGYVAVQTGDVVKIIPNTDERIYPSNDLPDRVSGTSDELVTQVVQLKNVNALQLVPVLRPLVPQQANINAYAPSNMIIIADRASNVNRLMRIIARVDRAGDADVEVIQMQNASATEVARVVTQLYTTPGANAETGGQPMKIIADERSNSVLVSGESSARLRARALIAHLDTPLQVGGETQVVYLKYEDAEKLAAKLKEQITGVSQGAPGTANATPTAQAERSTIIWPDVPNNALVITAPPKTMRTIKGIIDKLDIRRAQVLVEAIIVDVNLDKSAELGVNWALWSQNANNNSIPGATFLTPVGGASLVDLANAVQNPTNINPALESGTTVAVGRIAQTGLSFAAMLRALRSDDNSNVISTPSALTMDHQEATIKVAQEVPFLTGQYSNASTAVAGTVTPFQTIQREEVGTILKLTPQINGSNAIVLKIDLESSQVIPKSAGPQGAVDLTTSKRTVSTQVLIEDGGIIVIGGLIGNEYDRTETRVPILGSIPLIGALFKDRTATHQRKNLMVFIRPQILKDGIDSTIETNNKYNFIREEQRQVGSKELLPLLPGVKSPLLPTIPPPQTAPAPAPAPQAAPATPAGSAQPIPAPEGDTATAAPPQSSPPPAPAAAPPASPPPGDTK